MNKLFTKIASIALGLSMAIGVGVAIGGREAKSVGADSSFDTTYSYSNGPEGSTSVWDVTNYDDQSTYYLVPSSGTTSVATISGIFSGKTITSDVTITINSGTYGSGGNPTESTFKIYNSSSCTTQVTATKSGTLPTSKTYTNVVYTVSQSNATGANGFSTDLAILITKPGKQIRLNSIRVQFTYTASTQKYTVSFNANLDAYTGSTPSAITQGSAGAAITLPAALSCTGYDWLGWNTSSSGGQSTRKAAGSSYTPSSTHTLYGEWSIKTYTVNGGSTTTNISNGSLSSASSINHGSSLNITLNPSTHYHLPTSLTSVSMGGNTLSSGDGITSGTYSYTSSTGAIYIKSVTGNIAISASCVEDAKVTITYVAGDHGTGSNYVVSNQYVGSYTLATFATAGFTASSGYVFSKWNVGGTEYAEGASVTISDNTTVTAVYIQSKEFCLFSGALVEGDYLIFYSGKAMKASVSSSRFEYASFTPSNNKILTADSSVIWHIAASGNYWTIYNAGVKKYAASTGANAKGQLLASGSDDMSLWSCSSTSQSTTYEFINKKNSSNSVGANLRNNGTYGFACYSTQTGGALSLYRLKVLTSVASSGQTTQFTNGGTFAYNGTLTATYSNGTNTTVTPASFKIGNSGINPTTAGTVITTSTTLSMSDNGKYIYVLYTEDGVTKYTSYQITVNYAAVTSVDFVNSTTEIGNDAQFTFTASVSPSTANQAVTWSVADKDGYGSLVEDGEAEITSAGVLAISSENTGTVIVTVTTVGKDSSNNSKTKSIEVEVVGGATISVVSAISGYTGKNTTLEFGYSNLESTLSITSNDTSKVTVGTPSTLAGLGSVQVNFVAAGSTSLSFKDGTTELATCTVTVTASAVTSVTWSGSNFTCYSGTQITTSTISSYSPVYSMNNGDSGSVSSEYTVKLGGTTISLPYSLKATDSGKTLTLTYGGVTTSENNPVITVIQSLNTINGSFDYSHTFAKGEVYNAGYQDTVVDTNATWGLAYTWASSAPSSGDVDANKGQQIGSGNYPATKVVFSSSSFSGTITSVKVNCSGANDIVGTVSVKVGSTTYKYGNNDSASLTNSAADYTFTGNTTGTVAVTLSQTSSKALYIKSIDVTYIANLSDKSDHTNAQAAVVAFAQYMNTQMNGSKVCTGDMTNLGTAWGNVSSKYTELFGSGTSLSSSELAYAKKMLKSASASWNADHDSDEKYCLERAMRTYEWCVSNYSGTCTAFMSDVRTVSSAKYNPISSIGNNGNTIAIITVISLISVSAVGGYFLLRKRKED